MRLEGPCTAQRMCRQPVLGRARVRKIEGNTVRARERWQEGGGGRGRQESPRAGLGRRKMKSSISAKRRRCGEKGSTAQAAGQAPVAMMRHPLPLPPVSRVTAGMGSGWQSWLTAMVATAPSPNMHSGLHIALPRVSWAALGKWPNLSQPQFPFLKTGSTPSQGCHEDESSKWAWLGFVPPEDQDKALGCLLPRLLQDSTGFGYSMG